MTFKDYAIQCHRDTNHKYAVYLPYEFHLEMVANTATKFKDVWDKNHLEGKGLYHFEDCCLNACWGHDLLEDTRETCNDIAKILKHDKALDIIYAVTNEKGRNRKERANQKYYTGIRNTKGATFVKLCDRIANVKFGLMVGGSMLDKYKQENPEFLHQLGFLESDLSTKTIEWEKYKLMLDYLTNLFALRTVI